MSAKTPKDKTDWKDVSIHLFRALSMCMNNLKAPHGSSGHMGSFDKKTGAFNTRYWREIVADALEKFPGCTVDRDAAHAQDLPKKQRLEFMKKRSSEKKGVAK